MRLSPVVSATSATDLVQRCTSARKVVQVQVQNPLGFALHYTSTTHQTGKCKSYCTNN
jgi:hypothetical protein